MRKLWTCRRGVTMLEYSLIAALVAIAVVSIIAVVGTSVSSVYSAVNDAMSGTAP